jgi:hypothetical protein
MKIYELFSNRERRKNEQMSDVFTYDAIPNNLRVQIVHIFNDAIGTSKHGYSNKYTEEIYKSVNDIVMREYGTFFIGNNSGLYEERIRKVILDEYDLNLFFDVVELCMRIIDVHIRENEYGHQVNAGTSLTCDNAVREFNFRFREVEIGYQYTEGKIIRVDSQHMHIEVIKPALMLLNDPIYAGANDEFRRAFDYYKTGDNKNALVEALKAFESTMKAIYTKRNWGYDAKDASAKLVKVALDNQLIPSWQQESLTGLRITLETIGTPRNKMGGHGQGSAIVTVPDYFVRYALNTTASAIILLAEADKSLA